MFDIRIIREDPAAFDAALARRGLPGQAEALIALDARRRETITLAQEIQTRRNALSKQIGQLKAKGEDASEVMAQVATDKNTQAEAEALAQKLDAELEAALSVIPNLPAADVPDGKDESANVELRKVGAPPKFDFAAKEHFELGEALGLMDFEGPRASRARASSCSRARWRGWSARSARSCSTCRPARTATPRSRRRTWCATRRCTAPGSCRNLRKICFEHHLHVTQRQFWTDYRGRI